MKRLVWTFRFCFGQGKQHDVLFRYNSRMHPHCKDGDDYSAAAAAVVKIACKQCDQTWWGRLLTQRVSMGFIPGCV